MAAHNFRQHQRLAAQFAWYEAQAGKRVRLSRENGQWIVRVSEIN